jgi:hypothetical protein
VTPKSFDLSLRMLVRRPGPSAQRGQDTPKEETGFAWRETQPCAGLPASSGEYFSGPETAVADVAAFQRYSRSNVADFCTVW